MQVAMLKKRTPLWREAHVEVKMHKTPQPRSAVEGDMSKKCTPMWREARLEFKMYQAHHYRSTFASCDVEKVYAVVVRSTFRSENVQNTTCLDHFWTSRCRPDVEKVHADVARSTFPSQNC